MTSPPETTTWMGEGRTSVVPPAGYWVYIALTISGPQVLELQQLSDERLNEFVPSALSPPENTAIALLERVAADGWLERKQRKMCPNCHSELSDEDAVRCPNCGEAYSDHGDMLVETVYVRNLAPSRDVDWVIAIHGMNTTGAWQEALTWLFSTTWGRAVPVAVYKYGIVIAGVIMAWRRRKLRDNLREKLATLRDEARAQGFLGKPDVIAHSFGTWLFGHLLKKELARKPQDRLSFGRVILTGCILRPDFDWERIKAAQLVDDVLNHYGSKDRVVPLAHATIFDSGPSGRRGFDGDQVINARAEGFGHSDLFSIEDFAVNGQCFQKETCAAGGMTHLAYAYNRYWRPFLTLPSAELAGLPDRADPEKKWQQLPWPFRGTIFPVVALPLIFSLIIFAAVGIGREIWKTRVILEVVASVAAAGLALLLVGISVTWLWRRCRVTSR